MTKERRNIIIGIIGCILFGIGRSCFGACAGVNYVKKINNSGGKV